MNQAKPTQYKGSRRKNHWWTKSCSEAKTRVRFWYHLWKSCDRPRQGHVYATYIAVKKLYRKVCRDTMNGQSKNTIRALQNMHAHHHSGRLWNTIRFVKSGGKNTHNHDIQRETLENYYSTKFADPGNVNQYISSCSDEVADKYHYISDRTYRNVFISQERIKTYISKLKCGCSHGVDGILAEHIKWASGSDHFISRLCEIFTICIQHGVVPDSFRRGILVPLLKKPTCDPTIAKNYRPVIISTTLSKLLEMYVLEESGSHSFEDTQFGFVPGRGTNMAISISRDVISYCNKRGSPIFACSLDAEGAFDAIPHPVLFAKAIGVMSDVVWRIMFHWYSDITVRVKWNSQLGEIIPIMKGTRQGGLSSPFMFNLFYQGLVNKLSNTVGGVKINGTSYNVFCYADDVLLTSATTTGLQKLIDVANEYITEHGLSFNPTKTQCITFGRSFFTSCPQWSLNGSVLQDVTSVGISYLGATLANDSKGHCEARIKSCRRAFYAFQSVGLHTNGLAPDMVAHIWRTAIQPVLCYGVQCMSLTRKLLHDLDKTQSRLLKTCLGLSKYCRNTPLLRAMKINTVSLHYDIGSLDLLKSHFANDAVGLCFYSFMISQLRKGKLSGHDTLVNRCDKICNSYGASFYRYILDDKYSHAFKHRLKVTVDNDGVSDSVAFLLKNFSQANREMLNMLLIPF